MKHGKQGPQREKKIARSPAAPAPLRTAGTEQRNTGSWSPERVALMERIRQEQERKYGIRIPVGGQDGTGNGAGAGTGGAWAGAGQTGAETGAGQAGTMIRAGQAGAVTRDGSAAGVMTGARQTGAGTAAGAWAGTDGAAGVPALSVFLESPAVEKTKPTRAENEFMMNLMVLRNALATYGPKCRERARRAGKWVWRDIRLMLRLVNKVQDALIQTMPDSRSIYYGTYARCGHYELKIDGPVRQPHMVLISDLHLGTICETAMKSECAMCIRDGAEIGQCKLREALMEVAPPSESEEGRWRKCEYRRAAGDLLHGEEVHI